MNPNCLPPRRRGEEGSAVTATPLCIVMTLRGTIAEVQGPLGFERGWPEAPCTACPVQGQDTHQPAVQPQVLGEPTLNALPPPPEQGAAEASPQEEYLWRPPEFASCRRCFFHLKHLYTRLTQSHLCTFLPCLLIL